MSPAPVRRAFLQALSEAWAGGSGVLLPFGFFAATAMMVPFSVGAESETLAAIGPGVLWIGLALASMVTLERLFQSDLEDGALDLWVQENSALSFIALAKTLAHWLISGFPLVLLTPVFGIMLQVPSEQTLQAMVAYGLGGLTFYLWGGVAAALAAGISRGGLLIALLALPVYLPTLIFGTMTLQSGWEGAPILFLIASTLFALSVAPLAMGAALRLATD